MIRVDCHAVSVRGPDRDLNEDFVLLDGEAGLFVVADGMGGRPAGDRASRTAGERFAELARQWAAAGRDPSAMDEVVDAVNAAVRAIGDADPDSAGAGSTLSAVLLDGSTATIVHVGDSRIHRLRDLELVQLTRDHTLEAEFREHGPEEGPFNPRLAGLLTRALGTHEDVRADVDVVGIREGDRFVLLTDGVTRALGPGEIEELVRTTADRGSRAACGALVDALVARRPSDDATVAVVSVGAAETGP